MGCEARGHVARELMQREACLFWLPHCSGRKGPCAARRRRPDTANRPIARGAAPRAPRPQGTWSARRLRRRPAPRPDPAVPRSAPADPPTPPGRPRPRAGPAAALPRTAREPFAPGSARSAPRLPAQAVGRSESRARCPVQRPASSTDSSVSVLDRVPGRDLDPALTPGRCSSSRHAQHSLLRPSTGAGSSQRALEPGPNRPGSQGQLKPEHSPQQTQGGAGSDQKRGAGSMVQARIS